MKTKRKNIQPLIMLITGILLIYIVIQSDIKGMLATITNIPLFLFFTLIFLQIITQLLLNFQWYRICKILDLKTSYIKLLFINSYGAVGDAITSGEKVGGEIFRVIQLRKYMGYSIEQATIIVTIQKAFSMSALILLNLIVIVAMANNIPFLHHWPMRLLLLIVIIVVGIFLCLLLFQSHLFSTRISNMQTSRKWLLTLKNWVDQLANSTNEIRKKRYELILQFFLSFLIWAIFPLKLILLIYYYDNSIPFLLLFGITFISYFAGMIPLLPGGLGTFEATMGGMLTAYGLALHEGVAMAIVFRFVTFWFVLLFSIFIITGFKLFQFAKRVCST